MCFKTLHCTVYISPPCKENLIGWDIVADRRWYCQGLLQKSPSGLPPRMYLFWGSFAPRTRSACVLYGINLWPVIVVGQGKEKKAAVEQGRPPTVRGSEDRRQVLPVLVSCQKEAGPLIPSWLQRRNSIRGRTSWQKIRTEAAGWEASCCLHCNFVECLTKKGHFFLLFDLFLAVVNMICAVGWPFHVHFQLRAEDPVFHNSQLFCAVEAMG